VLKAPSRLEVGDFFRKKVKNGIVRVANDFLVFSFVKRYLKINGVWEDHKIYAITDEEFRN
jgi:hypothetical protein